MVEKHFERFRLPAVLKTGNQAPADPDREEIRKSFGLPEPTFIDAVYRFFPNFLAKIGLK